MRAFRVGLVVAGALFFESEGHAQGAASRQNVGILRTPPAAAQSAPRPEGLESRVRLTFPRLQPMSLRMAAPAPVEEVPICADADGVIRVAGTRVTLESIVAAFDAGATAEEIAQKYPTVGLANIYSVIAYYLRRRPEVGAYLARRKEEGARAREESERRFDPAGIRERLLARRGS